MERERKKENVEIATQNSKVLRQFSRPTNFFSLTFANSRIFVIIIKISREERARKGNKIKTEDKGNFINLYKA